jgi:hypothetical protein
MKTYKMADFYENVLLDWGGFITEPSFIHLFAYYHLT